MEKVIDFTLKQRETLKILFCENENGKSDALLYLKICFQNCTTKMLIYFFIFESVLPVFTASNTFLHVAPFIYKLRRKSVSLHSSCLS